jgi:hypothetical protein
VLADFEERNGLRSGRREHDEQRAREACELGPVCGALLLPLRAMLLDERDLEAGGHVDQRHRLPVFEQRHEQERGRIRLAVTCNSLELRRRDSKGLAPVARRYQLSSVPCLKCAR